MRNKSFLRAVAIVVCLAFFTLSVPMISSAKDLDKNYIDKIANKIKAIVSLIFLGKIHIDETTVPAKTKMSKKYPGSNAKIKKITGTVNSIKKTPEDE